MIDIEQIINNNKKQIQQNINNRKQVIAQWQEIYDLIRTIDYDENNVARKATIKFILDNIIIDKTTLLETENEHLKEENETLKQVLKILEQHDFK